MDATRNFDTNTTGEIVGWLWKMQLPILFIAACLSFNVIRLAKSVIPPPYTAQELEVLYRLSAVCSLGSMLAWFSLFLLLKSEAPMNRRGWMKMSYKVMIVIAGASLMVAVTSGGRITKPQSINRI